MKVGIAGCGWVASFRHLPSLKRLPGVEIHAAYDARPERAQRAAREFDIPHVHSSLKEFLTSDIELVFICTPPWEHATIAIEAAALGIHVFSEKPMATTLKEAIAMVEAHEKAGTNLSISHNFLYSRAISRARAEFAPPRAPATYFSGFQMSNIERRLPDWYGRLPGQLFFDECPHLFYLADHFLQGARVVGASSVNSDTGHIQRTKRVHVELEGKNGSYGQLEMLFDAPRADWRFTALSRNTATTVDLFRDIVMIQPKGGDHRPGEVLRDSIDEVSKLTMGIIGSGQRFARRRLFYGHDAIIRDFVESCRTRTAPAVAPRDALRVFGLIADAVEMAGLGDMRQ